MVNQKTSEVTPLGKCFPNPLGNKNDSQREQIRAKVLHLLNSRISAIKDIIGYLLIILKM